MQPQRIEAPPGGESTHTAADDRHLHAPFRAARVTAGALRRTVAQGVPHRAAVGDETAADHASLGREPHQRGSRDDGTKGAQDVAT